MEELGEFLRGLRVERGVSLRQLAAQAQVGTRTLSYWETGTYQPRLPELDSVLKALKATEAQRERALALADGPRFARTARLAPNHIRRENALGALPSGGDLLRALRQRRGLRLEQLAAQMGVSAATLSRWESGMVAPSPEPLERLLSLLGVRDKECAALKEGYLFLISPLRVAMPSIAVLAERFEAFLGSHYTVPDNRLDDLHFLSFAAHAWQLATTESAGRVLLASIYSHYATFLASERRVKEASNYAWRALDLLPSASGAEESLLRATLIAAQTEVYRGPRPAPERGLKMLHPLRDLAARSQSNAWLLADLSEYLALQADWQNAIALGEEACRIAERGSDADILRFRKMDMAKVVLRAGQAERALSLVTLSARDFPSRRARIELFYAEAFLTLEDRQQAHLWLERAHADVHAYDLTYLHSLVAALAKRF